MRLRRRLDLDFPTSIAFPAAPPFSRPSRSERSNCDSVRSPPWHLRQCCMRVCRTDFLKRASARSIFAAWSGSTVSIALPFGGAFTAGGLGSFPRAGLSLETRNAANREMIEKKQARRRQAATREIIGIRNLDRFHDRCRGQWTVRPHPARTQNYRKYRIHCERYGKNPRPAPSCPRQTEWRIRPLPRVAPRDCCRNPRFSNAKPRLHRQVGRVETIRQPSLQNIGEACRSIRAFIRTHHRSNGDAGFSVGDLSGRRVYRLIAGEIRLRRSGAAG